jgi:hypothetical protein
MTSIIFGVEWWEVVRTAGFMLDLFLRNSGAGYRLSRVHAAEIRNDDEEWPSRAAVTKTEQE